MKKALCPQYDELASKGNFSREDIVTMLTAHEGSSDAAFQVTIIVTITMTITITITIVHIILFIVFIVFNLPVIMIMQELNKAQLKPFLMRIWGQVCVFLNGNIVYKWFSNEAKIVKLLSRPNLARPLVEPLVQQLLETKKVKDFTILRRILLLVNSPIYCSFFVQMHLAFFLKCIQCVFENNL